MNDFVVVRAYVKEIKNMSKLFIDLTCGFREFAEVTGKEKELFPAIIKAVGNCEGKDECKCLDDNVYVINVENASRAADNLIDVFYGSDRESKKTEENAAFDCHSYGSDRIEYSDYLFAYKKRDFGNLKGKEQSEQTNERNFRLLLKEYIINFKPKEINEKKNLWLNITPQGKFFAVKKCGNKSIICDLSASERTLFNFLCFVEIDKFRQFINEEKNSVDEERPLIVLNFSEFLDEQFDYIYFLKAQNFKRIIILVCETDVPNKSH